MESFLLHNIETLRQQMIQEAAVQGQLSHEKVIRISQKLDKYIVNYQIFKQCAENEVKRKSTG
ncbi:aspartyl-phosphate phosphatase Spo0E family protein [Paenibacillus agricola]|uniref:Aspartyl-phosphate phosphatase Spo0E family protein n=1 Tax=Paenibacillus agricola TaxID=2716264 RepID=A0ABX0JHU5_9BACL|nr:aspartyl-phosphate phosphatase Spo0E family protein [Paenibacillus agricola]NHN34258.1 aspartyl-phosphate phosphatase Spo0E family protein [Paenibacillus agricola]